MKKDQVSGAVFMIGIGLLLVTGWWWPGIMFVLAASSMAQVMAEGRRWYAAQGALWMAGIGLIFWLNLNWGVVLIFLGLSMLLGWGMREDGPFADEKPKNDFADEDEKPKHDDYV